MVSPPAGSGKSQVLSRMVLCFTKMHGLGNDFIVVDATTTPLALDRQQIRQLSNRHTGIGFDQLLVVESPDCAQAQFKYRIFNADGGEVEHCGNGARCFARFVRDRGMTESDDIPVSTSAGLISLRLQPDGQTTVSMGVPTFEPDDVPFVASQRALGYRLEIEAGAREVGVVAIGNPHAVCWVDDVEHCDIAAAGPQIERHQRFPNRVNVGFAQRVDRSNLKLRVFERGVGETLACGTGACAAVAIGIAQDKLEHEVLVELPGGNLRVNWAGEGEQVLMTGPCETVFEGKAEL